MTLDARRRLPRLLARAGVAAALALVALTALFAVPATTQAQDTPDATLGVLYLSETIAFLVIPLSPGVRLRHDELHGGR